jgi:hypothetical protein
MLKAEDLYQELKTLEERIQSNTDPDGHCHFDAEKVYIMLKTALSFVPEPSEQANS